MINRSNVLVVGKGNATLCAAQVLPKDSVPEIVAAIEGLNGRADMRTITALLAAPPSERRTEGAGD